MSADRPHPDGAAEAQAVISIAGLRVSFGRVQALDGLSIRAGPGSIGILGPNGAGKTTLLRVLLGLLRPKSGTVRIDGQDPSHRAGRLKIRHAVGYMPEGDCLVPGMNAVSLVAMLARLSGLRRDDAMTRAHEVLDWVGLDESRYRDALGYSTGMKQRLKLAQALVHDPAILLLDEPTNGLDPQGRSVMLELVAELGAMPGRTLILCSHLLPDVEHVCRDVIVLNRGRTAGSGSIAAMTREKANSVRVAFAGDRDRFAGALESQACTVLPEPDGMMRIDLPGSDADADLVFAAAEQTGATILSVESARPTLEDVFLRAIRESGSGAGS